MFLARTFSTDSTDGAADAGVDAAGETVGPRVGQVAAVGVTVERTGRAAGVTAVTVCVHLLRLLQGLPLPRQKGASVACLLS
jgi:hypothetical protein